MNENVQILAFGQKGIKMSGFQDMVLLLADSINCICIVICFSLFVYIYIRKYLKCPSLGIWLKGDNIFQFHDMDLLLPYTSGLYMNHRHVFHYLYLCL